MRLLLSLFGLVLLPVTEVAAQIFNPDLYTNIYLAATDVANVDPNTLLSAEPVDVYHVTICNCTSSPVAAIRARFQGDFVNNPTPYGFVQSFRETAELPMFGPYTIADSFFVVGEGNARALLPAPGQTIDNGGVLAASYTLWGPPPRLVPARSERVIAVLSVAAGTRPINRGVVIELDAAIKSGFQTLFPFTPGTPCIPEPATCVLSGLASVGFAARRRV